MDGSEEGFAPDQANQLIVGGKLPVLAGGLGVGVDIEAAEEAVDALVGEAAFAEDTISSMSRESAGYYGLTGLVGGEDWSCGFAYLRRRQYLPSDRAPPLPLPLPFFLSFPLGICFWLSPLPLPFFLSFPLGICFLLSPLPLPFWLSSRRDLLLPYSCFSRQFLSEIVIPSAARNLLSPVL